VPVWEAYGRQMGPFGRCVCRMEAMCTGLEPYGSQIPPFGRRMAPYGSRICHYGSHMHKTGAASSVWESYGTVWELPVTCEDHMRAVCTACVLCAPYWRQMVPYGSHMHCVGTMQAPCAPRWSHVWSCMAPKWGPYGSGVHRIAYRSHMARPGRSCCCACTFRLGHPTSRKVRFLM
jgi:hypothetical protein